VSRVVWVFKEVQSKSLGRTITTSGFLPGSASWIEEMEKRSHRRFRDLVAHPAFQGLDANEIGCVRISIMAGSNTLRSKGRIQMSETSYLQNRSYPACNTRPVHTKVPVRDIADLANGRKVEANIRKRARGMVRLSLR
jgi:hypothetical protein